jgi:hypothetical protein
MGQATEGRPVMSTPTQTQTQAAPDTLPANYFDSPGQSSTATAPTVAPRQQAPDTLPADYFDKQENPPADPRKTGEITNDVGQKVIVPKDGESFSDTMKRAIAYHKSLTPEQQQAALDAEAKTMPKKTAQTLGAAATIGLVGPAALAAPGELAAGLRAVPAVGEALMGHLEEQAAEWMTKYPALTKLLLHAGIPTSVAGTIGYLIHKAK